MAPAPFVGDRPPRLWRAVLDPLHEGPVKLEAGAALGVQEAADVLRAAVARGNGRRACDRAAVPIEISNPALLGIGVAAAAPASARTRFSGIDDGDGLDLDQCWS